MIGPILENKGLDEWVDNPSPSVDWSSTTWSQRRYSPVGFFEFLFPKVDGGTALVERFSGCLGSKFIKELDYLESFFNDSLPRMVDANGTVLHETTIAVSVITFYIDLLHLDPSPSPPSESNMLLNFCSQ